MRRADDVVLVTGSDGRGGTRWAGEILDYSGRELRMRLATGREKVFPAARVASVSTRWTAEQQAADEAFAKADYRRAIDRYRAALDPGHENRDWVRRQILSQIVWCQQTLGQWEQACESFLLLLTRDPRTPYFDCIPLAWTPGEPTPAFEQKAKGWLSKGESPAATLLGASHLLSTGSRPAALEQLNRLSLDRDPRIALLAQAQIWRTLVPTVKDEQLNGWRRALDKFPDALRAGPDFIVASALATRQPEQAAILLMQVPILYPRQRLLAASALLAAGQLLEKLDRNSEAMTIYGELWLGYPDRPEAAEGKRRLGATRPTLPPVPEEADRGSLDERFVAGLRRRGLFALAEGYCRGRLEDPELADVTRAELVIELARTLAEQALTLRPEVREPVWRKAAEAIDEFGRKHAQNPRLLLVRMQAALVSLAAAELLRQENEVGSQPAGAAEPVRAAVRGAITQLKQIDEDIGVELRRRTRAAGGVAGQLSEVELTSLQTNVHFQLARAFRNQALCYPADSADRTNALAQALELVTPVAAATGDDPLVWPARLDELICLRLAGKLPEAAKQLAEFEKLQPPESFDKRLRAEAVRLLLAAGKRDEAFKAAGPPASETGAGAADLDFARLQAIVALWQHAAAGRAPAVAAEWEKRAGDEVTHIESLHGPYWMRRAETLLAGTLTKAARAESLDSLTRAAVSFYRGGQIDEALAAYDEAAKQAESKGQSDQAFDIRYTAAAIENQRKHFQAAADRFARLALDQPEHAKAAEAHLAAIYNAAEAAQSDKQPLDEYGRLLDEHLAHWPKSPTVGQVALWLGKLREHDQKWQQAATAYRAVPRDQANYAEAVEDAARSYDRLFAAQRVAGKADEQQAREAAQWLEQVISGPTGKAPEPWTALERLAALSAARIWMTDIPGGAVPAENLLQAALEHAGDAPAEWQTSARILLVTALAGQGRLDEAVAAVEKISGGSPADLVLMLDELAKAGAKVEGNASKRQLAELELKTIDALGDRAGQLSQAQRKRLDRLHALALAETGQHEPAVKLMDDLARRFPKDGDIQEELAGMLGASGSPDELRRAVKKWSEIAERSRGGTPRWFHANLGLAQAQLALGKKTQARSIVKLVQATHPDFGGAALRKQFEQVLAECEKAKE